MKKLICVLFLVTEILVFGCATNNQTAKPEAEEQTEITQENQVAVEELNTKIQENTSVENPVVEAPEEEQKPADTKKEKSKKNDKKADKKSEKKKDTKENEKAEEEQKQDDEVQMIGMPNPFEKKASLDAANKAAGFNFTSPAKYTTYEAKEYRVIKDEMVEIIYKDSANPDEDIRVRKANGNLDISGDYNSYLTNKIVNDAGIQILLRGEDDRYHAATWTSGDYSYAIDSKAGITENKLKGFIQRIY